MRNGERPKSAQERAKDSRHYNHTQKAEKTQHAQNLAHCGALEREGTRAKEPINVHNARRPPKTPHIKRKHMRTSKHTTKEPNAPHGQKMRPSRQRRRGRARAKPQRATVGEGREHAAHADLTKKTAFRTISFYLWALYIFFTFFASFFLFLPPLYENTFFAFFVKNTKSKHIFANVTKAN